MLSFFLFFISIFAGLLGALLGLGGGIIVVPVLTLVLGIDIRYAIAASLLSIIATSSGAAAGFLKDHLTNLRVAILLEVGTVFGAISGFLIAKYIQASWLFIIFGAFLLFSAVMMLKQKQDHRAEKNHPWANKLKLNGKFPDGKGGFLEYNVANVPFGLFSMFFAGTLSALLGIGSGIFKVMAMDGAMKLPMKVSSATSNFMIGVTASASAIAFFLSGDIKPEIACPVSLGILLGAWGGSILMPKIPAATLKKIFVVVMVVTAVQMIVRGLK